MTEAGKWSYEPGRFNADHGSQQIGSIRTPEGLWLAAVERGCAYSCHDEILIERVVAVLNRELPGGKPRVRRKKVA